MTNTKAATHQALKNTSHESMVASWLMHDGWQVFLPVLDHGHRTDILISDGPNFFRLQIKTFHSKGKGQVIPNQWRGSDVDYVVLLARNGNWGVIAPAFSESKRKLDHADHRRFVRTKRDFLKQFHQT